MSCHEACASQERTSPTESNWTISGTYMGVYLIGRPPTNGVLNLFLLSGSLVRPPYFNINTHNTVKHRLLVTTSKALVTRSDALVSNSFLLLVVRPGAPSSFLLLLGRHLFLQAYTLDID